MGKRGRGYAGGCALAQKTPAAAERGNTAKHPARGGALALRIEPWKPPPQPPVPADSR